MSRTRLILLFFAAWLIRGVWIAHFGPPLDHLFSDMATYVDLARRISSSAQDESLIFFPFGMPLFIAICFSFAELTGCPEFIFLSAVLTAVIAFQVPLSAAIAISCGVSERSATLLAVWLCLWPPSILQSSYFLSEHLFSTGMLSTIWLWSRAKQSGLHWSALAGACAGVTCFVRPQFLLGIVLACIVRRNGGVARNSRCSFYVLAAVLSVGVVRAYWHSGRPHFVSSNAGINLTFGACHNRRIIVRDEHKRILADFSPPVFVQLLDNPPRLEALHADSRYDSIQIDGGLSASVSPRFAWKCFRETAWPELLRGRLVHVAWLFFGNRMWPSSTNPRNWIWLDSSDVFLLLLSIPSLLIAALAKTPRREDVSVLLSQVFSMLLVSVVFFGCVRLRSSYDPMLMILVFVALRQIANSLKFRD